MVERERKLEFAAPGAVPDLAGVGVVSRQTDPVESVLQATYFDTSDRRLARAGVVLRRRTGGEDDGWHLKVPTSSGDREEIQLPPGRAVTTVPAALSDLVLGLTSGHRLSPVAHLKTDRFSRRLLDDDDQLLATLTDDHVTGTVPGDDVRLDSWRELEVELAEGGDIGQLDLLVDALQAMGARSAAWSSKLVRLLGESSAAGPKGVRSGKRSTAGGVIMAYLQEQADSLRRHDIGVRLDTPDAVHQMRVTTRKMRSTLSTFRRVLDRAATRHLAAELKWLAASLAMARDSEVLYRRLTDQIAELPDDLVIGNVEAYLTRHFARQQTDARAAATETLASARYTALLRELDQFLMTPPLTKKAARSPKTELRKPVRRADRRLGAAVAEVKDLEEGPELDAALHEVRKKAKQARYTADAARPAFGKRLRTWRARLKKIQRTLGDHHDCVAARASLRDLGIQAHLEGNNAFTYGLLYGHNALAATENHARFQRKWRSRDTDKIPNWLA